MVYRRPRAIWDRGVVGFGPDGLWWNDPEDGESNDAAIAWWRDACVYEIRVRRESGFVVRQVQRWMDRFDRASRRGWDRFNMERIEVEARYENEERDAGRWEEAA